MKVICLLAVLLPLAASSQPALPSTNTTIASPEGLAVLFRDKVIAVVQGFKTISAGTNAGSLSLAWDRSRDASAIGYRIYWGVVSSGYTNSAVVGNVTNCTMSGLAIGVMYFFAATAYDATGLESIFSNEASGLVPWAAPVLSIRPYVYIVEGTIVPHRTNRIQQSSNLTNWATMMLFVGGTNGIWSMLVTNNVPQRFYRVKVE